ncbi:MAG TPA: HAMP domain-containing sensor histidine kinase [Solirubrobacteraceae bacterium]|nr:HAMP domain-containing sensor histidine kinase [Solirubrobacteraceae bacterium]
MRPPEQILSSLPLRLRLTLAYTGVMAFVLAIVCVLMFLHTRAGIDQGIDDALALRAHDVAAVARSGDPAALLRTPALPAGQIGNVVQVVDAGGRIVAATPSARRPLLTAGELHEAQRGQIVRDRGERLRLLAEPVGAARRVVVVGADLPQREHALDVLTGALLIGGPLALALAALAGYALASGALRPVEAMRRRAATISAAEPDARLPLPEARDEIRRLGATLNEMLARMALARRRERAFVADASHELRTPLAILKGELELAASGDPDRAELRRVVASATEETDRLVALAEELLTLARLDDDGLTIRPGPLAVNDVMETVAASFAVGAAEAGRTLVVESGPPLVAYADGERLRQALDNLVENALRHGAGAVRLGARAADGGVEVHVRDEGDGFAPGFLPRAFDRFARGDGERRPGSGLGLAIVAAIAAAHGGSAHAGNGPGGGADVWIALPSRDGEPFTTVS